MQCKRCGKKVPAARVKAVPETELCVGCSEAVGGEFEMRAVHVHTGRDGSMKRMYGSVDVVKVRRDIRGK